MRFSNASIRPQARSHVRWRIRLDFRVLIRVSRISKMAPAPPSRRPRSRPARCRNGSSAARSGTRSPPPRRHDYAAEGVVHAEDLDRPAVVGRTPAGVVAVRQADEAAAGQVAPSRTRFGKSSVIMTSPVPPAAPINPPDGTHFSRATSAGAWVGDASSRRRAGPSSTTPPRRRAPSPAAAPPGSPPPNSRRPGRPWPVRPAGTSAHEIATFSRSATGRARRGRWRASTP